MFETKQTQKVLANAAGVFPCVISNLKHGKYKSVTAQVKCLLINVFKEVFDSLVSYRDDFSYNVDFIIREKKIIALKIHLFQKYVFKHNNYLKSTNFTLKRASYFADHLAYIFIF